MGEEEGSIGAPIQSRPQQAVLVSYSIDGMTGDELFRRLDWLERRLRWKVARARAGEYDGNAIGEGQLLLFAYGPSADRLFNVMRRTLRAFPGRPAHATLRYGPAEPWVEERSVEL